MLKNIFRGIAVLLCFVAASFASACSFGPDADIMKSDEENFKNKKVAVLLKIDSINKNADTNFSVVKYYKGSGSLESFTLKNHGHSCALTFSVENVGKYLLMFLDESSDLNDLGQWTPFKMFSDLDKAGEFVLENMKEENSGPVICTADAMQCSDGSWVGRSGPNCEFKCPDFEKQKPIDKTPPSDCKAWFDGCNTCARVSPDSKFACTKKACFDYEEPSCKQYFYKGDDKKEENEIVDPSQPLGPNSGPDFGPGPTSSPLENFVGPTSPPPTKEEKEETFLDKIISWFKNLFK